MTEGAALPPRVSVVIPTWNGRDLLLHALRSLRCQSWRDFETVVVDNGSTDDTLERVTSEFPDIRIIRLPENRGFAAGVNAGIRATAGDIVVLMNNDTEAAPTWLSALVGALDQYPAVSACASKMMDYQDRTRIDAAGVQFGLFASNIGQGQVDGPRFAEEREVFGACAGAAAYRRSVLDEVGLFDESFFAYFEDVDLGARIQLAGHRCLYVPDAVIYHRGSATSDRMADTRFYLLMRNALVLFFRYAPRRRLLWSPVVVAWPFVRAVIDGQPQRLALRAVRDFLRQLPGIVDRRRALSTTRRISNAEFHSRLVSPLARAGRESPSIAGGPARGALPGRRS
jgi:GT2 family glycosyltransferase